MDESLLHFYGLSRPPFERDTSLSAAFGSASRNEVYSRVMSAVVGGRAITAVRGSVGVGKTTALRLIASMLEARGFFVVSLAGGSGSPDEFRRVIAGAFGVPVGDGPDVRGLKAGLERQLVGKLALLIDDADRLPAATFRDIGRTVACLESADYPVRLVAFGRSGAWLGLDAPDLAEMRAAMISDIFLPAMEDDEAADFLEHKFAYAGLSFRALMTKRARSDLVDRAEGIPLLMEALTTRALAHGFEQQRRRITLRRLRQALDAGDRSGDRTAPPTPPRTGSGLPLRAMLLSGSAVAASAALFVWIDAGGPRLPFGGTRPAEIALPLLRQATNPVPPAPTGVAPAKQPEQSLAMAGAPPPILPEPPLATIAPPLPIPPAPLAAAAPPPPLPPEPPGAATEPPAPIPPEPSVAAAEPPASIPPEPPIAVTEPPAPTPPEPSAAAAEPPVPIPPEPPVAAVTPVPLPPEPSVADAEPPAPIPRDPGGAVGPAVPKPSEPIAAMVEPPAPLPPAPSVAAVQPPAPKLSEPPVAVAEPPAPTPSTPSVAAFASTAPTSPEPSVAAATPSAQTPPGPSVATAEPPAPNTPEQSVATSESPMLPMPPHTAPSAPADTVPHPGEGSRQEDVASPLGAPGLVLVAGSGDTLASLYARLYRHANPPPYPVVEAMNREPLRPGSLVLFPAPQGGWNSK